MPRPRTTLFTGAPRRLRTTLLLGATALLLATAGCAPESSTDGAGGSTSSTTSTSQSGTYRGTYEVPTTAELTAAAVFDVAEIEWEVEDATVKLEYDLPLALVGKLLRVEFTGPLDPAGDAATLAGPPGDATCTIAAANVDCLEHMAGLLPLTPDLAVVEELANSQFTGPASQRIEVAKQFSVDPIGIVRIDLTTPATPDPGETD